MRLLLDSHVLLWYDTADARQSAVRKQIDQAESVSVSVATIWELSLKQTLGKLMMARPVIETAMLNGATLLTIGPQHAQLAGELPLHHRDPFDRMLVAQAMLEQLTLVTHDRTLQQYGVSLLLA